MRAPVAAEGLRALKRRIAAIEGARAELEEARLLPLGPSPLDRALGGGLALGALHEVAPSGPCIAAPPSALRWRSPPAPWRSTGPSFCGSRRRSPPPRPAGPMALGLEAFGIPLSRTVVVRVRRSRRRAVGDGGGARQPRHRGGNRRSHTDEIDAHRDAPPSLAARDGGGLGLLVRHRTAR